MQDPRTSVLEHKGVRGMRRLQEQLQSLQDIAHRYKDSLNKQTGDEVALVKAKEQMSSDSASERGSGEEEESAGIRTRIIQQTRISRLEMRVNLLEEQARAQPRGYAVQKMILQLERSHLVCLENQRALKERLERAEKRMNTFHKVLRNFRDIDRKVAKGNELFREEIEQKTLQTIVKEVDSLQSKKFDRITRSLAEEIMKTRGEQDMLQGSHDQLKKQWKDDAEAVSRLREAFNENTKRISKALNSLQVLRSTCERKFYDMQQKLVDEHHKQEDRLVEVQDSVKNGISQSEAKLERQMVAFAEIQKELGDLRSNISNLAEGLAGMRKQHKAAQDVTAKSRSKLEVQINEALFEQKSRFDERIELMGAEAEGIKARVTHLLNVVKTKLA